MREPNAEYVPGDTFSYWSVPMEKQVTWTRDREGVWRCDDGRGMTATDADVRHNDGSGAS